MVSGKVIFVNYCSGEAEPRAAEHLRGIAGAPVHDDILAKEKMPEAHLRMLVEGAYTGLLANHRMETDSGKVKRLSETEWYRHESFFPVIIEREEWEQVQALLKQQARPANGNQAKHSYAGLLPCQEYGNDCATRKDTLAKMREERPDLYDRIQLIEFLKPKLQYTDEE